MEKSHAIRAVLRKPCSGHRICPVSCVTGLMPPCKHCFCKVQWSRTAVNCYGSHGVGICLASNAFLLRPFCKQNSRGHPGKWCHSCRLHCSGWQRALLPLRIHPRADSNPRAGPDPLYCLGLHPPLSCPAALLHQMLSDMKGTFSLTPVGLRQPTEPMLAFRTLPLHCSQLFSSVTAPSSLPLCISSFSSTYNLCFPCPWRLVLMRMNPFGTSSNTTLLPRGFTAWVTFAGEYVMLRCSVPQP